MFQITEAFTNTKAYGKLVNQQQVKSDSQKSYKKNYSIFAFQIFLYQYEKNYFFYPMYGRYSIIL